MVRFRSPEAPWARPDGIARGVDGPLHIDADLEDITAEDGRVLVYIPAFWVIEEFYTLLQEPFDTNCNVILTEVGRPAGGDEDLRASRRIFGVGPGGAAEAQTFEQSTWEYPGLLTRGQFLPPRPIPPFERALRARLLPLTGEELPTTGKLDLFIDVVAIASLIDA